MAKDPGRAEYADPVQIEGLETLAYEAI